MVSLDYAKWSQRTNLVSVMTLTSLWSIKCPHLGMVHPRPPISYKYFLFLRGVYESCSFWSSERRATGGSGLEMCKGDRHKMKAEQSGLLSWFYFMWTWWKFNNAFEQKKFLSTCFVGEQLKLWNEKQSLKATMSQIHTMWGPRINFKFSTIHVFKTKRDRQLPTINLEDAQNNLHRESR